MMQGGERKPIPYPAAGGDQARQLGRDISKLNGINQDEPTTTDTRRVWCLIWRWGRPGTSTARSAS
jgi:hypothetical protein